MKDNAKKPFSIWRTCMKKSLALSATLGLRRPHLGGFSNHSLEKRKCP
jgi:hypothetical protein